MKWNGKTGLLGVVFGFSVSATCWAGPEPIATDYSKDKNVIEQKTEVECNWYVSIGGGTDIDYGSTQFVRPRVIPDNSGLADLHVGSRQFDDVYDTPYRIEGELGYALGQHIELFGRFTYDAASGKTTGGSYVSTIIGRLDLRREFGDYSSYGGEVGLRYFFLSRQARFRPFLSVSGGATRVDSINLTARAANDLGRFSAGEVLFDGRFYGNSVVGTGSVLAGLEVSVTRCIAIGADAGLRYETKLAQDDTDLNRANFSGFRFPNLNKINDNSGDRLFCPVTLYAKFRF